MPSRDPVTGKRLGGAGQVRKKKQCNPQIPDACSVKPFAALPLPPLAEGVEACEAWANNLALLIVSAVERDLEPLRSKLLRLALRRLGSLKNKARISQLAVEVRHMKALEPDGDAESWRQQLTQDEPPLGDPVAGVAWGFLRLCRAAHEIATAAEEREARWAALIEACAAVGAVECRRQQRSVRRG